MKFNKGIPKKYRKSIEDAFETILEKGNEQHKRTAELILESEMLVCAGPVSDVQASGITGVIDPSKTNEKIAEGRLGLTESLGEVFITIAFETMGSQRGCVGTFVHENEHALDFARVIESFSKAAVNPLSIFDPSLYEMEWRAHLAAAEFMVEIGEDEYVNEGVDLMLLGRNDQGFFVDQDGIKRRLRDSYGLELGGNVGSFASQMAGIKQR